MDPILSELIRQTPGVGAIVFLVLALAKLARALDIRWPQWVERVPGYAVGTLGAFWFIERTAILMGWM